MSLSVRGAKLVIPTSINHIPVNRSGFSRWCSPAILFASCLVAMSITTSLQAGEYNSVLDIGDSAPGWESLPGIDDKTHSLQDFEKAKVLVVAFTCNSCPYALDAEPRLIRLVDRYREKDVQLVAINVNKIEEDSLEAMQERAKEQQFNFPYLRDDSQEVAKQFGAKYTPEFFVFDEKRKLIYMGALDDSPAGNEISKTFVRDAIDAALDGKSPKVSETVPIGCRIRYERTRRSRKR